MIKNHTVNIYSKTSSKNSDHKLITTYLLNKSNIHCNIQPLTLTDCERNGWGISTYDANAKIMFLENKDAVGIIEDWLIKWGTAEFFVKGINLWDAPGSAAHTEFKLRPVIGQSFT